MADRCHVHADLVRTPGLEHDAQERTLRQQALDLEVRARLARLRGVDRHHRALTAVPADRGIDRSRPRGRMPLDQRHVLTSQPARRQQRFQCPMYRVALGDHQQTGGVAVQAVDDSGAPLLLAAAGASAGQGLGERPGPVSARGVHHDSRRLVDDQQVLVLVRDDEVHRLWLERRRRHCRRLEFDLLAACELVALRPRAAVDEHSALADQLAGLDQVALGTLPPVHEHALSIDQTLGLSARSQRPGEEAVEPGAGRFLRDAQLKWHPGDAPPAPRAARTPRT